MGKNKYPKYKKTDTRQTESSQIIVSKLYLPAVCPTGPPVCLACQNLDLKQMMNMMEMITSTRWTKGDQGPGSIESCEEALNIAS